MNLTFAVGPVETGKGQTKTDNTNMEAHYCLKDFPSLKLCNSCVKALYKGKGQKTRKVPISVINT